MARLRDTQGANTIRWLLEPGNPSVRYFTLRHLLGLPEDEPEVMAAQAAIPTSRAVECIFSKQCTGGFWGDPTSPYLPTYKASYWTLMVLGHLGMRRGDELHPEPGEGLHPGPAEGRVLRAVGYIFRFQQPGGGFVAGGEEEARREYLRKVQKAQERGKKPPEGSVFVADYLHQGTFSCLTGNVVAALLRLGYGDDSRLWKAVDWLVDIQNDDGGWLCPYWEAHIKDTHSCFHGSICVLEAFAEIPESDRSPVVREATARAAEFLLMHRLYRADHHDFQVIDPRWLKLAFPWFYSYSILRGLWVLTRLGYRDERMEDALALLLEKRTSDGKWVLESTPYGRMQVNLEKKGRSSKWVTLIALSVLRGMRRGEAIS